MSSDSAPTKTPARSRRILRRAAVLAALAALIGAAVAIAKWERIEIYRVGDEPTSVAVGQLSGDGINDIIVGNALSSYVSFFRSRPDGLYNLPKKIRMGRPSAAVGIGRFDKGKRRDIVAAADLGNRLIVRYGKKRGFRKPREKKVGRAPSGLAVGKLNGDRFDDVVVANAGDDRVTIFKGSRKGLRRDRTRRVGNGPVAVAIGNVGGSKRRDIVVVNAQSKDVSILLGKKGGFRRPRRIGIGSEPSALAIGQLGRGRGNDVAVAAASSRRFTVLFGHRRGWEVRRFKGLKGADGVDIGRIDGDRRADVALVSSSKNKVGMFHRRGKQLRRGRVLAIPGGPTAIRIAHLDFDGNRDMATANVDGFSAAIIHQR